VSAPAPVVEEAVYRLAADRRGYDIRNGELYANRQRLNDLPAAPKGMPDVVGSYAHVAATAVKLNESQTRNSFLDYQYNPELIRG